MGNTLSVENSLFNDSLVQCHICKKDIEDAKDLVKCVRCKINLHFDCEEKYRNNLNYCPCPNCYKIGSLGFKY